MTNLFVTYGKSAKRWTGFIALFLTILSAGSFLLADDQTKSPPENAPKAEDAVPAEESKDGEQKTQESTADELLKKIVGEDEQPLTNPLDPIVEKMRAAQERLQKSETNQETRDLQAQAVKALDELIEKLKNQKPPPKSNQNQSSSSPPPMGDSNPNPMPRGGSGQPKPQNSQQQQQQSQQQRTGADQKNQPGTKGTSQADKARESNSSNGRKPITPEEEAARQRMAKDVWGHLPPSIRQQLLNVYSEKFLPKYDDLVRKYYEALAEQNRKNP